MATDQASDGRGEESFLAALRRWFLRWWRREPSSIEETVEVPGLPQQPPREPVGQVFTHEGHPEIAVVDLGRDISDALRVSWDAGHPFESGGVIQSVWLQPLFATGTTAASSLLAGNVFLATADPSTLITIGAGKGSAVIGAGGKIINHAPFVSASSALLPVVAPLMLFTTVSSLITGARLDRIQSALGTLSQVLTRVRQLAETEAYGRFQNATKHLDEIRSQFEHSQRFTAAMKSELAQVRRDLGLLHHQYEHLANRKIGSEEDARAAVSDINLFFLSTIMDIRADILRLYLTFQDDPTYAGQRHAKLVRKVEQCTNAFRALLDQDPIARFHETLSQSSEGAFLDPRRHFKRWFRRERSTRIGRVEEILETFNEVREPIERWVTAVDSGTGSDCDASIVVYRDLEGGRALHARYTRDLRLQQVGV